MGEIAFVDWYYAAFRQALRLWPGNGRNRRYRACIRELGDMWIAWHATHKD